MDARLSARLVAVLGVVVLALGLAGPVAAGAPVALDDGPFVTTEDTPLAIAFDSVIGNDQEPDGDLILVDTTFSTGGSNGTVTYDTVGLAIVYTPNSGFLGSDSFVYRITDGLNTATATVSVEVVAAPNQPPIAVDDEYLMGDNETLVVPADQGVLANDFDPDGDAFGISGSDTSGVPGSISFNTGDGSLSYTPPPTFNGTVQFTYSIQDGVDVSNVATVTIIVQNPTTPPIANDDAYAIQENTQLVVAAPGVLDNDSDADDQPISAVLVDSTDNGALSLLGDGSFTYTPNQDFLGTDTFTYRASDGSLQSGDATVTITVTDQNIPPVASDDEFQADRDTPLTIGFSDLLADDSDADGAQLFVVAGGFGTPANGTLQVDPVNGRFVYTPNAGFIGVDIITYRISDGEAESNTATIRITVTNVADPDSPTPESPTPTAPPDDGTGGNGGTTTPPDDGTGGNGGSEPPAKAVSVLPSTGTGGVDSRSNLGLLVVGLGLLGAVLLAWRRHRSLSTD